MDQHSEFERQLSQALKDAIEDDSTEPSSKHKLFDFIFDASMNLILGPMLAWIVFAWAGLLPWSFAGYLAVVAFVALTRASILDRGIA